MTQDPYHRHPLDKTDKIVEILSILIFITTTFLVIRAVLVLPDIVPCHFNFKGEADRYGSKYFLFIPVLVSIAMYTLMTVVARYPKLYKTRMSEKNIEEQCRLTSKMARTMKLTILAVFLLITYVMIETTELKMTEYLSYLILAVLVPVFGNIIYWLIRIGKIN